METIIAICFGIYIFWLIMTIYDSEEKIKKLEENKLDKAELEVLKYRVQDLEELLEKELEEKQEKDELELQKELEYIRKKAKS